VGISFRNSAGFGKRMEYKLIGDMLIALTVKIDVSKMQIFYFGLRLVAGQTFVIIG
jgi:hypothetical protein